MDVKQGQWFYDAIKFVDEKGLFEGTSATTFSPNDPMTRAMLVTVLYRLEGEPAGGSHNFSDVAAGLWYSDAVAWAAGNNVVKGISDTLFDPNSDVTREQIAQILYNYAGSKGYDTAASSALDSFTDGAAVASWAQDAVKWAVGAGLVEGKDGGALDPAGSATRAEVATMLQRFVNQFVK